MSRWLLRGGGRWAKVLTRVLREVLPQDELIDIWSPSNQQNVRSWVQAERMPGVEVLFEEPDLRIYRAALIANRARDHVDSALKTLGAGLPTLVEKPAALTEHQAMELVKAAESVKVVLYPALVLLYAEYLRLFAAGLDAPPELIELEWRDPMAEERWGMKKRFDSSISVIEDVLPHVYSVVCLFCQGSWNLESVNPLRGGQEVHCEFLVGSSRLRLQLGRNAEKRCRKLKVSGQGTSQTLDFSTEPGTIMAEGVSRAADPDWSNRSSPLTLMLSDFYKVVNTDFSSTLMPTSKDLVQMTSMSEQATHRAHQSLAAWWSQKEGEQVDRDYAKRELEAYGRLEMLR